MAPQAVDTCESNAHAVRIVVKYWQDNKLSNAPAYKQAVVRMLKADNVLTPTVCFDLQRHCLGPMPKFDKQGRVISQVTGEAEKESWP